MLEVSGGSKTLGRVFGYLMLAEKPKTLDEIAAALLFSKATASLTIRQGLIMNLFEKVSIPGHRKDYYRANIESWINATISKMNTLGEWKKIIEHGLEFVPPDNQSARQNLDRMKDYFDFILWYLSDINEYYERWEKGEINQE